MTPVEDVLAKFRHRYLVIGSGALRLHGIDWEEGDLDIWLDPNLSDEDWQWPPVPEPPIEVLVPPPLPNVIWPRLPPHHPYHLPPGYHWPDNLPPGHPGHDVKPPKPPGGSGDAGSEGSGDEVGSSDSEGC